MPKLTEASEKSADLKDDAKVQADKTLADLHAQREALGKKFDELKQSSQDTWDKDQGTLFRLPGADMEKAYDDA